MNKKYIVRLSPEERQQLECLVTKGKGAAYRIKHAHILLAVDAAGPNWMDAQAAQAFRCDANTVRNVRQRMGLSQTQFATKFGFPPATLRNWEQGRARPDARIAGCDCQAPLSSRGCSGEGELTTPAAERRLEPDALYGQQSAVAPLAPQFV